MSYSRAFQRAVARVLAAEGGYANDANDPGGETNLGISKRCLDPDALVLDANLFWRPVGSLVPGDELIAFDEIPERRGKLHLRRLRRSKVKAISPVSLPAMRIVTESRSVVASEDHQWLVRRGEHRVFEWRRSNELLRALKGEHRSGIATRIASWAAPWRIETSRAGGYLAGVLDGEGHIDTGLSFTQKDNACASEALSAARELGIAFRRHNLRHGVWTYSAVNERREPFFHVSTACRLGAQRLRARAAEQLIGRSLASRHARSERVVKVEPIGRRELVGLETSTRTVIVEGLLSHNSYPNEDIAGMTSERATEIYFNDYWVPVRGDELPFAVALVLFDCAVNQGVRTAIRFLQAALKVGEDGVFGSQTLAAVEAADAKDLAGRFLRRRVVGYSTLEGWPRYHDSWLQRCFDAHRVAIEGV